MGHLFLIFLIYGGSVCMCVCVCVCVCVGGGGGGGILVRNETNVNNVSSFKLLKFASFLLLHWRHVQYYCPMVKSTR